VDSFGRLDVLVNNAGYGQFAPFEQMSAEDFQAVVGTCFYGVEYTTRAAVPVMRQQKSGHIFQVSSVGGRHAVPGNTPYHAAKWAVGGFSQERTDRGLILRQQVRRILNGAPCLVGAGTSRLQCADLDSEGRDFQRKGVTEDVARPLAQLLPRMPLGRVGQPHDIATVASFLASKEAG
jgi:NAD(P)-dependent dehydrogenase (short-subunit alcohol dehydrogenase family)